MIATCPSPIEDFGGRLEMLLQDTSSLSSFLSTQEHARHWRTQQLGFRQTEHRIGGCSPGQVGAAKVPETRYLQDVGKHRGLVNL